MPKSSWMKNGSVSLNFGAKYQFTVVGAASGVGPCDDETCKSF